VWRPRATVSQSARHRALLDAERPLAAHSRWSSSGPQAFLAARGMLGSPRKPSPESGSGAAQVDRPRCSDDVPGAAGASAGAAPRCLTKNATFVPTAEPNANAKSAVIAPDSHDRAARSSDRVPRARHTARPAPANSEPWGRIMVRSAARSVSPSSSRFPGDVSCQRGREAVGDSHRNNDGSRYNARRSRRTRSVRAGADAVPHLRGQRRRLSLDAP
jgi:hypothetical protein